jgi:hypothetical protein
MHLSLRTVPLLSLHLGALTGALCPALAAEARLSPVEPAPLAQEAEVETLPAAEVKKLAKAVTEYYAAYKEKKGVIEARTELEELIAKAEKKAETPLLGRVHDWEQILLAARERKDSVSGKGRIQEIEVSGGAGFTCAAWVRAPKDYRGSKQTYPLVLLAPDKEQDPGQLLQEDWNLPAAADGAVFCAVEMPADLAIWDEFGDATKPGGLYHLMFALGHMVNNYSIDPHRVILVGRGLGVAAMGELGATFPERFAGVVGLAGDLGDTPPDNYSVLPSLWVGGGAKVTAFGEAATALGRSNVRIEASLAAEGLWTWIDEQRRNANPLELRFRPRTNSAQSAYWLRAIGFDVSKEPLGLVAKIERESNTVTIEAQGVSSVELLFNDALVDLSRPVRVVINGVEQETQFDRSLVLLLDRAAVSGDPGRIYTAHRSYDVQTAPE